MGGSSKQVTGYRYFANFLLFIGNPIEKVLGINFDKRGWQTPLIDEQKNPLSIGEVKLPNLYGENEGGVAGKIHARYGTANPQPVDFYSNHLAKNDLPPLAYPYQSYLAFKDFYLGNSGYMKEMLLWVKRTRVRNDGREQWYEVRGDRAVVCEIGAYDDRSKLIQPTAMGVTEFELIETSGCNLDEPPITNIFSLDFDKAIVDRPYLIRPNEHSVHGFGCTTSSSSKILEGDCDGDIHFSGQGVLELKLKFSIPASPVDSDISFSCSDAHGELSHQTEYFREQPGGDFVIFTVSIELPGRFLFKTHCKSVPYDGLNRYVYAFSEIQLLQKPYWSSPKQYGIDINPIHKIREILTDDTAMSKPESDVNDVNFRKAADRIWDEGLGISWSITEKSCLEAIEELCGHIEAGVRVNRQTGLYEMVLFRDDWFDENEIHTLAANKIKSMSLEIANADEAINQLNVSYYNREAIKDSSFSIAENASIRNLNGRVNAEGADFPYFMNQRNAAVVAQWKLKQMSSPVWKGSFTTAEYNARKWNRYDLLKLAWPRKWQGEITVRIMKINLGTGADVSVDFVEVVPYSSDLSSSIVIDTPVDTSPKPPKPALFKAFELSYLEAVQLNGQKAVDEALAYNPDAGYAAVIAKRPQTNSLNALMYTDMGNDFERAGAIVYSETAELDQSLSKMDHAFIVKKAGDIDMVSTGTQITVNNEIMVYQSYDEETGLLTVKRGALDTIPQNHLAGSVLYFADDFITVDPTEYVTGEIINVKALTTTPSGILSLDDVDAQQVEIQARAIKPYPPANVKINEAYWPTEIETDLVLTWVDRNRIQQTGGEILGWYEGGVTLESGVTYAVSIYNNETNEQTYSQSGITGNTLSIDTFSLTLRNRIEIYSVRDGYESYSKFVHVFNFSGGPFSVSLENGDEFTLEDGATLLKSEQ